MREVSVSEITKNIREMCIEANHFLSPDMKQVFDEAVSREESPLGKQILNQLEENLRIAGEDMIPICQDTGMAVVFLKAGQEVHFTGGSLTEAVNEGVRQGYTEGFLRKSVVQDPIERVNTGDNTPAILHYEIVEGDSVEITVAPKGFGSENMSRVFMLKPADGIEGVKEAILTAVRMRGPMPVRPWWWASVSAAPLKSAPLWQSMRLPETSLRKLRSLCAGAGKRDAGTDQWPGNRSWRPGRPYNGLCREY